MILQELKSHNLIHPPKFLVGNTQYLTRMGSEAYGVSIDSSDVDIYGFTIPPKELVFPHLDGEILGFGKHKKRFEQFQSHHVEFKEKQYDFSIYSIVKYFHLCMENNPNMIDSLFTPFNCVNYITSIGQMVRESRKLFLHKGCWHKFKGYAYSQVHKMKSTKKDSPTRRAMIEQYGYDCYLDKETEFLTEDGWKQFDNVKSKVATVNIETGELEFQQPIERIEKIYSGIMYILEPQMNRCVVTETHNMLVSAAHRGKRGIRYDCDDSEWKLIPFASLLNDTKKVLVPYKNYIMPSNEGISDKR